MKKKKINRYIKLCLMVVWMIIVFCFSNQPGDESDYTSSRTAEIMVNIAERFNIIKETNKEELIHRLNSKTRKIAHYLIYTIGGILILGFINTFKINENKKLLWSVLIGAVYAASDELHQFFVEGRSAHITDVMLDTIGVATGVCISLYIIKSIKRRK